MAACLGEIRVKVMALRPRTTQTPYIDRTAWRWLNPIWIRRWCRCSLSGWKIGLRPKKRLTMANMAVEAGGKNGIFIPDAVTEAYVKGRAERPYTFYTSDPDAGCHSVTEIDVSGIEPQVSFPHLPSNAKGIGTVGDVRIDQSGKFPATALLRAMSERHGVRRSLGRLAERGFVREEADGRWRLTPTGVAAGQRLAAETGGAPGGADAGGVEP